jgi:signal transduction histidine kinase
MSWSATPPTIRGQLTRRLLVAFGIPLILAGLAGYVLIRTNLLARLDASLLTRAESIASATTWDEGRLQVDASKPFMREFDAPESTGKRDEATEGSTAAAAAVKFFEVRRGDGEVMARSASLSPTASGARFDQALADTLTPETTAAGPGRPRFWDMTLPSGLAGRVLVFPFVPRMPHEGTNPGPIQAILLVAAERQDLNRTLASIAVVFGAIGLVLAVTIAITVATGLRRTLAPLDTLVGQASRIDADSLATRFPVAGLPGELRPIVERLNDLLSRVERAFERERQFSANVAHELRTPLAELRASAELSLKWPETHKADTDRDTLAVAIHMEGIVTRLLALLRSERGQLPIAREQIALAPFARNVWLTFAERATVRHLQVAWREADDIGVDADPVLLRSILVNLMENAVEYTPEHGEIDVELTSATESRFQFRLANAVDALTDDHVSKLFDRFWRRDAARAGGDHSGLGLSLARAFACALDYELTATLASDSRQLVLTLSGPCVRPDQDMPAIVTARVAAHVHR